MVKPTGSGANPPAAESDLGEAVFSGQHAAHVIAETVLRNSPHWKLAYSLSLTHLNTAQFPSGVGSYLPLFFSQAVGGAAGCVIGLHCSTV